MTMVFDQYDVAGREEFVGSFVDDYVTGSLVSTVIGANGLKALVTGSRGRVFSKYNAAAKGTPDTSGAELAINPFKAMRLEPWFEKVGSLRFVSHVDTSERYYDSMLPSIADVFKRNGAGMFVGGFTTLAGFRYGDEDKVDLYPDGRSGPGRIIFNYQNPDSSHPADGDWTYAYPFEPRYSGLARQQSIEKTFIATSVLNNSLEAIAPKVMNGLFVCFMQGILSGATPQMMWFGDANLSSLNDKTPFAYYTTSSMNVNDISRVLFGFGDTDLVNFDVQLPSTPIRIGYAHTPGWRDREVSVGSLGSTTNHYVFGPVIRGWKYGLVSGLATYSKAHFRRNSFGMPRDMLEQRQYTKFFIERNSSEFKFRKPNTISQAAVYVQYVNPSGSLISPLETDSSNLHFECTSSLPFFDGLARNR